MKNIFQYMYTMHYYKILTIAFVSSLLSFLNEIKFYVQTNLTLLQYLIKKILPSWKSSPSYAFTTSYLNLQLQHILCTLLIDFIKSGWASCNFVLLDRSGPLLKDLSISNPHNPPQVDTHVYYTFVAIFPLEINCLLLYIKLIFVNYQNIHF
jgi:hypothetical protein